MIEKTPGWRIARPGRFTIRERAIKIYPPGSTGWVVEKYLVVGEPVRLVWKWNQEIEELIGERRLTLIPMINWDSWVCEMWVDSKPVLEANGIKPKILILEEQVVELPIPAYISRGETTCCLVSEINQFVDPLDQQLQAIRGLIAANVSRG
ncbi:hypothetical protein COT44_04140 [Candidatus Shapirobacteria bacterium CG08_land_8_20_14_0_20_39_18]|uniref:DUF402 domain-containing protein n=1 Tax=Candidatus Shapirobacteria bacterium CG08_land_8_20_14_0_20_39_18 TaxID=1974883 RepID=A0A2M6XCB1_9BACT|nr:MAG: hypothetical protein COT44_04140 [Candidatus Shapirobacteria bacterium CG08_land_8_20_14_0_20_39_18]PIY66048.1 MAG: hypothetical protein COY91_01075 [Candidatus Shapirobacteria bacterium CG_4_10_14_0_8_um_filter_39_15]